MLLVQLPAAPKMVAQGAFLYIGAGAVAAAILMNVALVRACVYIADYCYSSVVAAVRVCNECVT